MWRRESRITRSTRSDPEVGLSIVAVMGFAEYLFVAILMANPCASTAQISRLVIGEGGVDWVESIEQTVGLDTSLAANGLQPVELDPSVNINVGPLTESGQNTNIFGGVWLISSSAPADLSTDGSPYIYGAPGRREAIDGDVSLPTYTGAITNYSIDFGLPLPINRVVFFPPASGGGAQRALIKDLYPRQYVVSGSLSEIEYLTTSRSTDFDDVLKRKLAQSERVADVRFPIQFLRFVKVRFPVPGFIAEIEVYGEGFAPQARYVSQLFDMGAPVTFGRLHYVFEKYRKAGFDAEPAIAPDAPVHLAVEIRSGRDETPRVHHIITELGTERVVDLTTFNRAPAPTGGSCSFCTSAGAPGQRGSVQDDIANWSFWSVPHLSTGEEIRAPDGRRFFKVRMFFTSEEVFAYGRLKSLSIEYSPLLADRVLGEIARADEPQPVADVVEVSIGEPVMMTYDVRADFTSASQGGFDAIRIVTPEAVDFQRFEMGEPLAEFEPDSLVVGDRALEVYFPSNPVEPSANVPLRLIFATRVFNFNTLFEGEVFQIAGKNLPQSINSGDATPLVSTDDLRVIAPVDRLEVISELDLSSDVVTPNGDGIQDRLELAYTLHGVSVTDVELGVYDLAGRLVHRLVAEARGEGRYTESWDGLVQGQHAPPGIYLLRVVVDADLGTFVRTRTIGIVY
ncbi:MAG: hypothetical protein CME04_04035 [Gemmatimonadaceae bacterium]|nr:hypothetical protein [Gemmatimonadaceae bacterium]